MTSTIDFAPIVTALGSLALAAFSAAIPILIVLFKQHTSIALTDQQVSAITNAADKGAELAYGILASNATTMANVSVRNAAVAAGANHVLASVPDALTAMGIDDAHVKAMVEARLGGLVAKDPSTSITPPPVATDDPTASPVPPPLKPASGPLTGPGSVVRPAH